MIKKKEIVDAIKNIEQFVSQLAVSVKILCVEVARIEVRLKEIETTLGQEGDKKCIN